MKALLGILLGIAILSPLAFAEPIPGPAAKQNFLFASPNVRESLTDKDAEARLTSFEQINATAVADRAACALTEDVHIANSLGIYDKSSENSFIVEAGLELKQSEYLAALLGLYSRQEFILLFLDEASGGDRLWIVETPQSLDAVMTALRKLKLTPATVRAEKDRNEIWFVDPGEKRAADVKRFTSDVNGQAGMTAGIAEMLGNQRRSAAVKQWKAEIYEFEKQSGRRVSQQLSSKGWRHTTAVHTCSKDMSIR